MSEVQSRPAASRGRGSGRGGRGGGHSTRGGGRAGNRSSPSNGDTKHDADSALPTLEDEGEVGQMKKQYGSKVSLIKEMFPDWSDVDILFALRETDGDENLAVTRIAEGSIPQWGEVSKSKKGGSKTKAKNDTFTTTTADSAPARNPRGGRGGSEGARAGGRGRATERGGRGGSRGKSAHGATNGAPRSKEASQLSVPTEESSEWDTTKPADETNADAIETSAPAPATETTPPVPSVPAPTPAAAAPKTWASMLRQATVPKAAPKPKEPASAPKPAEPVIEPLPPVTEPVASEPEPEAPVPEETAPEPEPEQEEPAPPVAPAEVPAVVVPEVALPPSKDQLTETNLEQIIDESKPQLTDTVASEAADSWDPRASSLSATATPLSAIQQQHQAFRTPATGYAATAQKATERATTRTPIGRRILDQQEAVRMPGNRDQVDRAAVQFGAFSLNGPIDDDIDGDREEPETRPQPPEDSPVAHPRTSLPPAQTTPVPDSLPAQKPATSLPPTGPAGTGLHPSVMPWREFANTPSAATALPPSAPSQAPAAAQGVFRSPAPHSPLTYDSLTTQRGTAAQPAAQSTQPFGRFGQAAAQEPASFPTSKPFEPFSQQQATAASAAQSQFEGGFPNQAQAAQQPQAQQQAAGAYSSAPADYSAYYTADQHSRYNNYYNQNYGQQHGAQGQQDTLSSQPQRSFSGYNAPAADNLSQYPQSSTQHAQSRFGATAAAADAQIAGTPTPAQSGAQGQSGQTSQAQPHGQQQPHDYAYNSHPYYANPYYAGYLYNQGGYNQGAYGAGPYGKGGLGYQPNQYGMTPQGPHGYGSSPAGAFGQSSLHRADSGGVGAAGLSDYARAGSAQSGQQQGLGAASGFGGMHDTFGRGASAFQSQAQQSFNAPGTQPGNGPSGADDLKPFADAKAGAGPSPSLGAAARPGSAANNAPSQPGLPPPQSNQQSALGGMSGYGSYPSHLAQGHGLHGTQTGAGGYGMSAGGSQGHQSSYGGGYGGQSFGGNYYANPPRGWGNNYH
ncbi:hypothetical protein QBC46DRAFT_409131 [Diplogelasinospora grovesii]|uniref:RNA polymerase II degradation factor 1 n=1 Tax=Diplogelasinospora grovesii TaxID=303347 RepID=A0AAN6S392_9PEZI|nr:hypothetical protein QBC46DRAFT_409131 [Diplogelasinospora grovesii]